MALPMSRKIHVYIAGPISSDPLTHTNEAIKVADYLMDRGLVPFVPHLTCIWQIVSPREYEDWMEYDFAWLAKCDALYRIDGVSPEVMKAHELGIPVFTKMEDLLFFFTFEKVHLPD